MSISRVIQKPLKQLGVFLCFWVAVIIHIGCREKVTLPAINDEAVTASVKRQLNDLTADDIVVSVNNVPLTKHVFDENIALYRRCLQLQKPTIAATKLDQAEARKKTTLISEFVVRQLFLQEAKKLNLVPEQAEREALEMQQVSKFRGKVKTFSDLLAQLGSLGEIFKREFEIDLLMQELYQSQSNQVIVTDAEIDQSLSALAEYNQMAQATNKQVVAFGAQLYARLQAGADFAELADEFTEDETKESGYWGEFIRGQFDDEQVEAAAFTLPIGAYSKPLDTVNGLVIVKVLDRVGGGAEETPPGAMLGEQVTLARILRKMAVVWPQLSRDEIQDQLVATKRTKMQHSLYQKLLGQARIEYPNGTNLFDSASILPVQPRH